MLNIELAMKMFKKTLRVIQKETSLRPRNRNQYLYVRSIGLGCWGTCPTATQGGEGCLIKFPGLLWTSSARTAWRRPRWIVYPSEFFLGDQKWHNCREREIWTVWRVTENLRLYWLSAALCQGREWVPGMRGGWRWVLVSSLWTRIETTKSPVEASRVTTITKESKAIHTSAGKVMLSFFFDQDSFW